MKRWEEKPVFLLLKTHVWYDCFLWRCWYFCCCLDGSICFLFSQRSQGSFTKFYIKSEALVKSTQPIINYMRIDYLKLRHRHECMSRSPWRMLSKMQWLVTRAILWAIYVSYPTERRCNWMNHWRHISSFSLVHITMYLWRKRLRKALVIFSKPRMS